MTPLAPPAPTEPWNYDLGSMQMTFEPTREVACSCGRKASAYIITSLFVGNPPDTEPRRWVRPPPGWFVWAGADGNTKGPFVRCDNCMGRRTPVSP